MTPERRDDIELLAKHQLMLHAGRNAQPHHCSCVVCAAARRMLEEKPAEPQPAPAWQNYRDAFALLYTDIEDFAKLGFHLELAQQRVRQFATLYDTWEQDVRMKPSSPQGETPKDRAADEGER